MLGDVAHRPRYIETIPKKGYRLICPIVPAGNIESLNVASNSPAGWRRRGRIFAVFAAVASIAVALGLMAKPGQRDWLLPAHDGPGERSIAVLPFVDMSEDGSQQHLGRRRLGRTDSRVGPNLPELRVTARTSSFAFRDSQEDVRIIGSKLGVATILEGSVRKDGDRIRVTSQLVDTRDGYHLMSQTYDRDASDLLSVQREIATEGCKNVRTIGFGRAWEQQPGRTGSRVASV